jgi:nucleoside-diphosphate-sugar epimerase
MSKPKVLITGATGYIGANVARMYYLEGYNVNIITRKTSDLTYLNSMCFPYSLHEYNGEIQNMVSIMKQCIPNLVVHLASLFISEHKPDQIDSLLYSNIFLGTHLVEAMSLSGVDRLINVGTSWQHYKDERRNPVCFYAATKEAYESILTYYQEAYEMKIVTLKLFDTYGPKDPRPKLVNMLIKHQKEKTSLLMTPGQQHIDMVYIEDIVEAFSIASKYLINKSMKYFGEYVISSQKPVKVREFVDKFIEISGYPINVEWGRIPYRKREVMFPYSLGSLVPNWEAKISIDEGIKRILTTN